MQSQRSLGFVLVFGVLACSGGELPTEGGGGTTAGGNGSGGETTTTGGNGGDTTTTGGSASGGGGAQSTGGAGGAGPGWPSCLTQPAGSIERTIPDVWSLNPSMALESWVPGVYVSAISGGGCTAGQSCAIFVQTAESYIDLADATHQSLRIGVAPAAASYFEGIAVGDQIDLFASAFRDPGTNELYFLVSPSLPGCANVIGQGNLQPVDAVLDDFTVATYETDIGPVLVRIDTVTGNPNTPPETFALWDTGTMPNGDITQVTSLSPFCLPGEVFTGLTDGMNTDFAEVVGVFSIFSPPADPPVKYEEICVRSSADYPLAN